MTSIETCLKLDDLEQLLGIASRFALDSSTVQNTALLNSLKTYFSVGSAALVQLGRNYQPISVNRSETDGGAVTNRTIQRTLAYLQERRVQRLDSVIQVLPTTAISAYGLGESGLSVIILRQPVSPFGQKAGILLRTLHTLISPTLRAMQTTAKFLMPHGSRLQQVFEELSNGLSDKQIAAKLHISPHTVHVHVKRLFKQHAVHSRAELLSRCFKRATSIEIVGAPSVSRYEIPGGNIEKPEQNITPQSPVAPVFPVLGNVSFSHLQSA